MRSYLIIHGVVADMDVSVEANGSNTEQGTEAAGEADASYGLT